MNNVLIDLSWEISGAQTRQAFECWQQQCAALTDMCNWDVDFPFAVKWRSLWTSGELPRGKQCNALNNTHIFRRVSGPTLYSPL